MRSDIGDFKACISNDLTIPSDQARVAARRTWVFPSTAPTAMTVLSNPEMSLNEVVD
jgi:hypothetical protein